MPIQMAQIITFHGRAARSARSSKVTPASFADERFTIADHHSGGMLSRCHHLETTDSPAPISARNASRVGHKSMMERNDLILGMPKRIGHYVLKRKPKASYDNRVPSGHNVLMLRIRQGIVVRTLEARERAGLTQVQIANALGIPQDTYKNYETIRPLPHELIPLFCGICGIEPSDLYPAVIKKTGTDA